MRADLVVRPFSILIFPGVQFAVFTFRHLRTRDVRHSKIQLALLMRLRLERARELGAKARGVGLGQSQLRDCC